MNAARVRKGIGMAVRIFLAVIAVLLVVYIVYMLIARYAMGIEVPTVFGMGGAVVLSGSMEPELSVGDYVITVRQDSYEVGDVIMFYSADGVCTTHRIVEIVDGAFRTKGDANNAADVLLVSADAVIGEVVAAVPGVGTVIGFLQTPAGLCIVLAVIAIAWFAWESISRARARAADGEDVPPEGAPSGENASASVAGGEEDGDKGNNHEEGNDQTVSHR